VIPETAIAMAKAQANFIQSELTAQGGYDNMADKRIIALVAYMQRLGTDLTQPEDWDPYAKFWTKGGTPASAPADQPAAQDALKPAGKQAAEGKNVVLNAAGDAQQEVRK
jgi:hypothetical protein